MKNLTLREKVAVVDAINKYKVSWPKATKQGTYFGVGSERIYIKDQLMFNLITKKLFRRLKVGTFGLYGEFKSSHYLDGQEKRWQRFKIREARIYSENNRERSRVLKSRCTGDDENGWKYAIGNFTSIEEFLVCMIGYLDSFYKLGG